MRIGVFVVLAVALAPLGCKQAGAPADNSATPAAAPPANMRVDRMDPALDQVVAPDAKVEKVAGGFLFNEGPMWREGRLWFSDLVGNKMYAVSPDGKVELLIDKAGGMDNGAKGFYRGSNAMATDKDGSVLMCQHSMRRIARVDDKLHVTNFLDKWNGKRFNSPNDLVFAPDGSLWFTDPPFGLDKKAQDPAKEIPFSGVYRYAHGKVTAVIKDLDNPNGIGFSPDGKVLYISNTAPHQFVDRYDVKADGTMGQPTTFISYPDTPASEPPDGLKLDSAGNLWTTGPGGIRIINPQGKVLGQIKLPEVAANLAWGGDDGKTLYITATSGIYRVNALIAGELPLYRK
jgi:gluconolactonase